MRASIEELTDKANKISTFLEWLQFALVEADRYTYDSTEKDENGIIDTWAMVIGCQASTIKAFLAGEHKVTGDFIWSVWTIWCSEIYGLSSNQVTPLVSSAWGRINDILDPHVCNQESGFKSNISPGIAIVAHRLKSLRFAIGGMMDFDGQIKLINETIGKASKFTIDKYRK